MMELEELLQQVDIVDYISQYVELTEKNGEYWGLSPFKEEKTPSFSVRRETGRFYDFSSGLGGSCLSFVYMYKKCSKREAFEELKRFAGIEGDVYAPSQKLDPTKCFKKYSRRSTPDKPSNPTILQPNYMDRYEVRKDKLAVWEKEGISEESLRKFNVRYDPFNNCIVYPIYNLDGKIVNIGYRTLDPDFKIKGLRKYWYGFKWGSINTIYGLYDNIKEIIKLHQVIIFEGCKSVLKADTWGIKNSSALLTSHLSDKQMIILIKLGCDVVFALDKEIDIKKDHNINKMKKYINVYFLYDKDNLLSDKDSPVDQGKETFMLLYNRKIRYK